MKNECSAVSGEDCKHTCKLTLKTVRPYLEFTFFYFQGKEDKMLSVSHYLAMPYRILSPTVNVGFITLLKHI